jgi:cullin 1
MDEDLLQYYTKQWNRYTTAARLINNIFMYINRYWVKREIDEDKKHDVYDIFTVGFVVMSIVIVSMDTHIQPFLML